MATKSIAWNTGSGNITLTYTGQGNGTIQVASDPNNLGSARSQVITVETTQGGVVTKNLTINQAACPVPVGTVLNYSYTGSYQEVTLPAGSYKLQCWGAQGGSNAAASSYGITAKAGGKGGYSEGVLTLISPTKVRIYVGGQGSSSVGGYNGGGSTTGSSTYNASNEQGVSRMGGGGGATDIRLSDGSLYSRMIVAGGGSGGAMCYQKKTTSSTNTQNYTSFPSSGMWYDSRVWQSSTAANDWCIIDVSSFKGGSFSIKAGPTYGASFGFGKGTPVLGGSMIQASKSTGWDPIYIWNGISAGNTRTGVVPSDADYLYLVLVTGGQPRDIASVSLSITTTTTTETNDSQVGYVGGGTTGGGYSSSYKGKQNAAGRNGSFGQGANQTNTTRRYCPAGGGGGWYGGGNDGYSNSTISYVRISGGGSGFVNVAASAGNRPSGYTGLQLDSGETKDGATSFPSTSGSTETGHSGSGYARITRIS